MKFIPSSLFAYSLISLHHDIIWYLILVISLVCWSLYQVCRGYSWNNFVRDRTLKSLLFYSYGIFRWFRGYILDQWYIFYIGILESYSRKLAKLHQFLYFRSLKGKGDFFGFFYSCYVLLGRLNIRGIKYRLNYRMSFWYQPAYSYLSINKFSSHLLFNGRNLALLNPNNFGKWLNVQKFNHSTKLEYIYGSFSLGIIGCIVVPSVYLLYSSEVSISPSITVKVIGHQWYWSYEYTNFNASVEAFDSLIEEYKELNKVGTKRLLDVDLIGVLPSKTLVRFLLTSSDVLHSFSIPELGVKMDAVPGRLNQFMVLASRPGIYYGQCSELCGVSHGFMPISMQSVSHDEFFGVLLNGSYGDGLNGCLGSPKFYMFTDQFAADTLYSLLEKEQSLAVKILHLLNNEAANRRSCDGIIMEYATGILHFSLDSKRELCSNNIMIEYLNKNYTTDIQSIKEAKQNILRAVTSLSSTVILGEDWREVNIPLRDALMELHDVLDERLVKLERVHGLLFIHDGPGGCGTGVTDGCY